MERWKGEMDNKNNTTKDVAILVFKQVFAFIAVNAACGWIVWGAWKLITGKAGGTNAMILTSAVYSVLVLLLFVKKKWSVLSPAYLQSRPWAVLAWAAVAGAGAIIPEAYLEEMMPDLTNLIEKEMLELVKSDLGYFTLCLFAPFVEETVFRGAVLRTLLPHMKSRWAAIAISAALFSLVHMNPAQMPFAFIAGLMLGWLYSRTGSILPGVAYHWVNNTVVFAMARLLPPQMLNGGLIDLFGGDHRRMGLAVIFSFFIFLPAIYQLNIMMRKAQNDNKK